MIFVHIYACARVRAARHSTYIACIIPLVVPSSKTATEKHPIHIFLSTVTLLVGKQVRYVCIWHSNNPNPIRNLTLLVCDDKNSDGSMICHPIQVVCTRWQYSLVMSCVFGLLSWACVLTIDFCVSHSHV